MRILTLCLLLAVAGGCAMQQPPAIAKREIADCPNPWPPKLCGDIPDVEGETLPGLVAFVSKLRAWGTGCRSEVLAWRTAAADCQEKARRE